MAHSDGNGPTYPDESELVGSIADSVADFLRHCPQGALSQMASFKEASGAALAAEDRPTDSAESYLPPPGSRGWQLDSAHLGRPAASAQAGPAAGGAREDIHVYDPATKVVFVDLSRTSLAHNLEVAVDGYTSPTQERTRGHKTRNKHLPAYIDSRRLSTFEQPVQSNGDVTSVGSRQHPHGCKPCAFHCFKRSGCKEGADCGFCHMPHVSKTQVRRDEWRRRHLRRKNDTPLFSDPLAPPGLLLEGNDDTPLFSNPIPPPGLLPEGKDDMLLFSEALTPPGLLLEGEHDMLLSSEAIAPPGLLLEKENMPPFPEAIALPQWLLEGKGDMSPSSEASAPPGLLLKGKERSLSSTTATTASGSPRNSLPSIASDYSEAE